MHLYGVALYGNIQEQKLKGGNVLCKRKGEVNLGGILRICFFIV